MTAKKELIGHESPETAYVVDDYPYGYSLRCKIRYWIETTKNGQRACSQTTNPKKSGEVWNKPKKSTYSDLLAAYLDDNGHVVFSGLSYAYNSEEVGKEFKEEFPLTSATEYGKKALHNFFAIKKAQSVITCTVVVNPPPLSKEERLEKELQEKKAVNRALQYGFAAQAKEKSGE